MKYICDLFNLCGDCFYIYVKHEIFLCALKNIFVCSHSHVDPKNILESFGVHLFILKLF